MSKIYFIKLLVFGFIVSDLRSQSICQVNQLPASLQTGLIAFYPFCGNANDVTINGYNGTVTNATLTTDRFGNANSAYAFDASTSRIDVNSAFFDTKWIQYSISCWSSPNKLSQSRQVFFNTTPHWGVSLGMREPNNDFYGFAVAANGSNWDVTYPMVNSIAPQNNVWTHHVLVKNGNVFTYYINGISVDTKTVTTPFTAVGTSSLIFGGIDLGYLDYQFGGSTDDYMIYNRVLTPQEVVTLTTAALSVKENVSVIKFHLYPNPNSGNFFADIDAKDKNTLLSVYDVVGKKLLSQLLVDGKNKLNVNLSSGLYFVKLLNANGDLIAEKKIVIE